MVLGISRQYGIPELVEPAVKALAKLDVPLSGWSTDPHIICHTTLQDVGTVGRMKEKILLARFTLCKVPNVTHDATCPDSSHATCSTSWKNFWMFVVVPKLCDLGGEIEHQLWWIRTDCVAKANIPGMSSECMDQTINDAIKSPGWRAETKITQGAVDALMVEGRTMLDPVVEDEHDPDAMS